jgi:hypothetical protein
MTGNGNGRDWLATEIRRAQAAILSVNDTVTDSGERERMRRVTLNSLELLEHRVNHCLDGECDAVSVPTEL